MDEMDCMGGPPDATRLSRTDMMLRRRAARERWGVPDAVKNETIYQATKILADPDAGEREKLAAMRVLATFDRVDQADDKLKMHREKLTHDIGKDNPAVEANPIGDMLSTLSPDELATLESIVAKLAEARPEIPPCPDPGGELPA